MNMTVCRTDEDYEKFAFLFLRNRKSFADSYTLLEAIGSLYRMIDEAENILLFSLNQSDVIAALSYTLGTREENFEDQHIVFIDCALVENKYQNSRVFVRGLQQMLQHIVHAHKDAQEVRFYAYRHHQYVHSLYKKFATIIEEKEGFFGIQDVFSVEFDDLAQYLERFNKKKVEWSK